MADGDEIVGKIVMPEKIKDQVGIYYLGQKGAPIIDHPGETLVDGNHGELYTFGTIDPYAADFTLPAAVLLKNHYSLLLHVTVLLASDIKPYPAGAVPVCGLQHLFGVEAGMSKDKELPFPTPRNNHAAANMLHQATP